MMRRLLLALGLGTSLLLGAGAPAGATATHKVFGQTFSSNQAAFLDPGPTPGALDANLAGTGLAARSSNGSLVVCNGTVTPSTGNLVVIPAATGTMFGQQVVKNTPVVLMPSGADPTAFAQDLHDCNGVSFDHQDNLYIATWKGYDKFIVVPKLTGHLWAQSVVANTPVTLDPDGAGTLQGFVTVLCPSQIAFDANDNAFALMQCSGTIVVIAKTSTTLFGQGFAANVPSALDRRSWHVDAFGTQPDSIQFGPNGDLYVTNYNDPTVLYDRKITVLTKANRTIFGQAIRKNTPTVLNPGGTNTLKGQMGTGGGGQIVWTTKGDLIFINYNSGRLVAIPARTGTLFGQAITQNVPLRLRGAGNSLDGLLGSPGPYGMVITSRGDLLITSQLPDGAGATHIAILPS